MQIHSIFAAHSRQKPHQTPASVRAEKAEKKLQTIAPMELAAQEAMALGWWAGVPPDARARKRPATPER